MAKGGEDLYRMGSYFSAAKRVVGRGRGRCVGAPLGSPVKCDSNFRPMIFSAGIFTHKGSKQSAVAGFVLQVRP